MRNDRVSEFINELISIVGEHRLLLKEEKTRFYRTGIRVGSGKACAIIFPDTLLQFWKVLEKCIYFDKVIILQAANTGLTGGSTPDGDDYDRDVTIINTLYLDQLTVLNGGEQVLAFPGTTLYQLEEKLKPLGRGPHSIIGSSCIGASVIGGVCNNSGGNLVNRGPAYTELSLFARLNAQGKLELINHLEIELGDSPEEILVNLQSEKFHKTNLPPSRKMASDNTYKDRVRDINSSTPARFNSDKNRLYESSGCAGKVAVFAVRLDTFLLPAEEQVFFVGTNDPQRLTVLREKILSGFENLPDMGEYMHRGYFDGADKYCKDTFLFIKYLGTNFLPRLLFIKRKVDQMAENIDFLPTHICDKILQFASQKFPDHLPKRIRQYRDKFEHYMLFLVSDSTIEPMQDLLDSETSNQTDYEYIKCTKSEGRDALLHRYVSGGAPARYRIINESIAGDLLPLDIALPRNCHDWYKLLPPEILTNMSESFQMGHFLCMVFHWDFVVNKGVDASAMKRDILRILDKINAKYPAEHNVGHFYHAEESLQSFYKQLDPKNSFNCGIGKMSKNKDYR